MKEIQKHTRTKNRNISSRKTKKQTAGGIKSFLLSIKLKKLKKIAKNKAKKLEASYKIYITAIENTKSHIISKIYSNQIPLFNTILSNTQTQVTEKTTELVKKYKNGLSHIQNGKHQKDGILGKKIIKHFIELREAEMNYNIKTKEYQDSINNMKQSVPELLTALQSNSKSSDNQKKSTLNKEFNEAINALEKSMTKIIEDNEKELTKIRGTYGIDRYEKFYGVEIRTNLPPNMQTHIYQTSKRLLREFIDLFRKITDEYSIVSFQYNINNNNNTSKNTSDSNNSELMKMFYKKKNELMSYQIDNPTQLAAYDLGLYNFSDNSININNLANLNFIGKYPKFVEKIIYLFSQKDDMYHSYSGYEKFEFNNDDDKIFKNLNNKVYLRDFVGASVSDEKNSKIKLINSCYRSILFDKLNNINNVYDIKDITYWDNVDFSYNLCNYINIIINNNNNSINNNFLNRIIIAELIIFDILLNNDRLKIDNLKRTNFSGGGGGNENSNNNNNNNNKETNSNKEPNRNKEEKNKDERIKELKPDAQKFYTEKIKGLTTTKEYLDKNYKDIINNLMKETN